MARFERKNQLLNRKLSVFLFLGTDIFQDIFIRLIECKDKKFSN